MLAKMKTRLRPFLAASMVLALLSSSASAAEKIKLDYIPADAVGAVVMQPSDLSKLEEFELLPWEVVTAAGKDKLGIDPLDIEQALAFVASPSLNGPPEWGVVIHSSSDIEFKGELLGPTEPAEINGTSYHCGRRPDLPSYCVVDGKTLLLAPETSLKRMLAEPNSKGPLHELLSKARVDSHATIVVTLEPMRGFIEEAMPMLPPLPLPLNTLRQIPEHLESLEANINLLGPGTEYRLQAKSEKSAQELERIINSNLAFSRQVWLAQIAATIPNKEDPIQKAVLTYARRLADVFEKMTRPTREGSSLVIRIDKEKSVQATTVAVAGIGVALLLPAVQAAREAARRLEGENDMKQIMLSMHNHHEAKGHLPAAANYDKEGKPLLSWRVHVLPFVEQGELYRQFHLDEPWDSEHNRKLISKMPDLYRSPYAAANATTTNYLAVTGKGNAFDGKKGLRFTTFVDGLSNTIMVVEADLDRSVVWTKPADLEFDADDPLDGLGNLHPGVFQVAIGDGSIGKIRNSIDLGVLRALMTRGGREAVNRQDF